MMVLIPKGGDDYHSIGIMEVVWKEVAVILDCRFTTYITYHNYLHRFRADRDTGTTTLEVKLIQQVEAMREAVLHEIFQDLHKVYNALDRSNCLDILETYSVGPRDLRLLRRYLYRLQMMEREGGCYR